MPRQHANARQVGITAAGDGKYEIKLDWPDFDGESERTFSLVPCGKQYMCGHAMASQGLPGLVCLRGFDTRSQLTMHRKSVHELKPFGCLKCGKLILDGSNYDKHVKSCTNQAPRHTCQHCGVFRSRRRHNLKRHMRTHHPEIADDDDDAGAAAVPTLPAAATAAAPAPFGTHGYQQPALFQGQEQYAALTNDSLGTIFAEDPALAPVGAFEYQQPAYAQAEGQYIDTLGFVYRSFGAYLEGEDPLSNSGPVVFMEDASVSDVNFNSVPVSVPDFDFNSAPVLAIGPDLGLNPCVADPSGVDWHGNLPAQGTLNYGWGGEFNPAYFAELEAAKNAAAAMGMDPNWVPAADYSVPIDPALEVASFSAAAPGQDDVQWDRWLVPSVREGWTSSAPVAPPAGPSADLSEAPIKVEEGREGGIAPCATVVPSEVFAPNSGGLSRLPDLQRRRRTHRWAALCSPSRSVVNANASVAGSWSEEPGMGDAHCRHRG